MLCLLLAAVLTKVASSRFFFVGRGASDDDALMPDIFNYSSTTSTLDPFIFGMTFGGSFFSYTILYIMDTCARSRMYLLILYEYLSQVPGSSYIIRTES